MKHLILSAGLALSASAALAETELRVHYAIPTIWTETQDKLTAAFMAATHAPTRSGSRIRQAPKVPDCTRSDGQPTLRLNSS